MLTAMDTMTSCGTPSWVRSFPSFLEPKPPATPFDRSVCARSLCLHTSFQTAPEVLRGEKYTEKCDVVRACLRLRTRRCRLPFSCRCVT